MNLSQPAISLAVSSLERRIGGRLLERNRTGSATTEFGEILLFRIRRLRLLMVQAIQKFASAMQGNGKFDAEKTAERITISQIQCLVAISESVSFEQASRVLGISLPSLHRAARELEKLLRAPLYVRSASGITTTKHGTSLARQLNLALTELRYGFEEINYRKGIVNSSIAVGTQSAGSAHLLAVAMKHLLNLYPDLTIKIIEAPYEYLLNELLLAKIDVLFNMLTRPEWATEVVEEVLYRDRFVAVCRPNHPILHVKRISKSTLAAYRWIIAGNETRRYQALIANCPNCRADVITTSRGITRELLANTDRLTLLSRQEALADQRMGIVSIVPFEFSSITPAFGVVTRKGWLPTRVQHEFLQLLRDVVSETESVGTTKSEEESIVARKMRNRRRGSGRSPSREQSEVAISGVTNRRTSKAAEL